MPEAHVSRHVCREFVFTLAFWPGTSKADMGHYSLSVLHLDDARVNGVREVARECESALKAATANARKVVLQHCLRGDEKSQPCPAGMSLRGPTHQE